MSTTPKRIPRKIGRSEIWERADVANEIRKQRKQLGRILRAKREQEAWTLAAAAEHAGISTNHLWKIEQGMVNVTHATLVALSLAYRCKVRDFFPD